MNPIVLAEGLDGVYRLVVLAISYIDKRFLKYLKFNGFLPKYNEDQIKSCDNRLNIFKNLTME